jgi:predicted transcriptional regulator
MTTKEKIVAAMQMLPADTSIDHAIDRLYLLKRIERGIAQADAGDVMEHEEFMKEIC